MACRQEPEVDGATSVSRRRAEVSGLAGQLDAEVTDLPAAGDGVWVTDKVGGSIFRVDPTTNAVAAEIAPWVRRLRGL